MSRFLAPLIGSFLIAALPHAAIASPERVEPIARETAVSIDGCNAGSGVIIERQGTTYSVLTLKTLLADAQTTCWLVAPDGSRTEISPDSVSIADERVNLAIVEFESDKTYRVADLGSTQPPKVGETIYIAALQDSDLQIEESQVAGLEEGEGSHHRLVYDSTLKSAFQGAPVFNQEGETIGIHGLESSLVGGQANSGLFLQKPASDRANNSKSQAKKAVAPWFGAWKKLPVQQPQEDLRDLSTSEELDLKSAAKRDEAAGASDSSIESDSSESLSHGKVSDHQKAVAIDIYAAQGKKKEGSPLTLLLILTGMSAVVVTAYSL